MKDHAITLLRRPVGRLSPDDLAMCGIERRPLEDGQARIAVRFLSIDPYVRGVMDDRPFVGASLALGGVVPGRGLGEIVESRSPRFKVGDLVLGEFGWRDHAAVPVEGLRLVNPGRHPVTWQLGVLGIPGVTAWLAMESIAAPRPGETVLVSSAAGTVGSTAGQIARLAGCRVVGITSGALKSRILVEETGFDHAIDRLADDDLARMVRHAAPGGVDIFFDNVGGPMLDSMLALINPHGRVVICGHISGYEAQAAPEGLRNAGLISASRLRVQGFLVRDHREAHADAMQKLTDMADAGDLRQIETLYSGLEQSPKALVDLLNGKSAGKTLVALTRSN